MNNFSFLRQAQDGERSRTIKVFGCFIPTPSRGKVWGFILLFLVFSFFAIDFVYAGYPKIAPGDTVTLGEFVFDDNFVATTTACTVGITNPLNVEILPSSTPMTANDDGWHYYNYSTTSGAVSGIWPSVMKCGSVQRGDLVIVDKSFIVDWSVVTTSTIKDVVDDSYTVTLSDFGGTTVNTAYKAKLQVLNYATVPTDADSDPAVVIKDPLGSAPVPAPAGTMSRDSAGTYSYSYSITSGVGGVWETVVSVVINGKTIKVNDYWSLSSSPADVDIIGITDKVIPTITANVRIDNKGTSDSDFYYVYCIVSSEDNLCGGNDDIDSGSATAYINKGSFINLSLTLDEVPGAGTYWFKVKARALAETNWAASTEQFTAESAETYALTVSKSGSGSGTVTSAPSGISCGSDCSENYSNGTSVTLTASANSGSTFAGWSGACSGTSSCVVSMTSAKSVTATFNTTDEGGGGGGGGGGGITPTPTPTPTPAPAVCNGADFNGDKKVNSVDFSILLAFWQKIASFKNPCVDINKDNKVNSVDFSIMLYQWKK